MNKLFIFYLFFMLLIGILCLAHLAFLIWTGRTELNAGTLFIMFYPILGIAVSLYLLIIKTITK